MANSRDSFIIEKIKDFRVFAKEMPLIRNCYQFIKEEPRKANEFLRHLKTASRNAPYMTIREPNVDMDAFELEIKATDTMRNLKDCLESRRELLTLENMKSLLMEIALTSEDKMESDRIVIAYEIYKELKPKEISGSEIGFVRKMLEVNTPITRKADDVVEVVVNTTLKELLGDTEDTFFQIDYSAIIDLEDINVKISPILREYLKCKSTAEGVCFLASHQELLEIKYLRELYEQCYRYFLKGMRQEAKGLSVMYDVLKKTRTLKEMAPDYFNKRENMVPWPKGAKALYEQIEKQSINIRENYISNFHYKFKAIPSYEFVAVVPNETEKNYPLFMCLTGRLRQSLIEGSFTAVDETLRGMSPAGLKNSLTMCAIGGFFYFKTTVKSTDFGILYKAVNKAIEKL